MKTVPYIRVFEAGDRDRVKVMCRFPQTDLGLHTHDFVEIVVIWRGRARHWNGAEEHDVGPGDVLLIPPDAAHGYQRSAGCELHNVLVRTRVFAGWLREVDLGTSHQSPLAGGRAETRPWLRLAAAELAETDAALISASVEAGRGDDTGRFVAEAKLREVVGRFARLRRSGAAEGVGGEGQRVRRVLYFAEENAGRAFSLGDWAKAAGVSVRTLNRLLTKELKTSPGEYLRRLRLARATQLLRESGLTVTEVAFACGFEDSNYFARAFRREFGRSPRAWREARRSSLGQ